MLLSSFEHSFTTRQFGAEPSSMLTTLDGGQLYPYLEMNYELKTKNGGGIISFLRYISVSHLRLNRAR